MSFLSYLRKMTVVHKCIACREILPLDEYYDALCKKCRADFERAKTESCLKCNASVYECICQPTLLSKNGSLCYRKLCFYHKGRERDVQSRIIFFLKHNRNKRGFDFIASQMCTQLSAELSALGVSDAASELAILNLPRGRKAVVKYGFDQAAELAYAIAQRCGAPYIGRLKRKIGGKEQKKLTAAERQQNMKNVIYPSSDLELAVKDRYVILVDDVVTTGASMSACLGVLRKCGVKGVICASFAADFKDKKTK